jgi:hypothetical protein
MRFTEIDIPEELAKEKGLSSISMNRLGNVVLISGQKGSGKTRLLEKIKEQVPQIPPKSVIKRQNISLQTHEDNLVNSRKQLSDLNNQIKAHESKGEIPPPRTVRMRDQMLNNIDSYQNALQETNRILQWNILNVDNYEEKYSVVSYVPKELKLDDSAQKNPTQILSFA